MDRNLPIAFSFIIPTMGEKCKLNKCVESIIEASKLINHNYNIEILIIYSKDSKEIIYHNYHGNVIIKTIMNVNNNVSRARNIGIQASRGEYAILVDDDAYIGREFFVVLNKYAFHKKLNCVCGRWLSPLTRAAVTRNEEDIRYKYLRKCNFSLFRGTCIVIKKNIIESVGCYDENYGPGGKFFSAEESDLFFRLKKNKVDILFVHDLVFYHPIEENNSRAKVYQYSFATGKLLLNQILADKLSALVYLYLLLRIVFICNIRLLQLMISPSRFEYKDNRHRYLYVLKGLSCAFSKPFRRNPAIASEHGECTKKLDKR